ncbi:MAG: carbohydrate binding family 9 domain-containing protein [Alcanivoracaceae bacterium]|nr:carbohydrate binding family 9 domain-containing protein [Alcanivoracaceae bacterium]
MKIILLLLITTLIQAENYQVPLVQNTVVIDGVLDDEIWQYALQVDMPYEIEPDNTLKAEVKTKAYIVDRGHSIVFAFHARDPNPEKIRAFLRDRDSAFQDDFVGVMLDTYNDQRRALEFFVNPLGVQMDLIRDESGGGTNEDDSWDAIWDSAGKITSDGYVVEMEIPYNELQMPKTKGEKTWGISLFRSYPRNVRKQIAAAKLDRNNSCFLCQIDKFTGFANAERGLDLEITPSITVVSQQQREDLEGSFSSLDHVVEPSLDINWGINSNLTLNATLNPDFSQVESDSAQLDVNQTFALFFPEKRPFFLENSDFFNSRLRLVHTRIVASPDYGIRLVGKSGKNAYGFFYTDDTVTNILIPGVFSSGLATLQQASDNLAARYRRDFGNSSTVGALITRRSADDYSNVVSSIDSTYKITDENAIIFQYANSKTTNPQQISDDFDQAEKTSGDALFFRYRHSDENLFYHVTHMDYADEFRADLGFIGQIGFKKSIIGAEYTWRPDSQSWWNRFSIYSDWDITHDQQGRLIEKELEANFNISASKQSNIGMNGYRRQRLWNEVLFDETRLGFDINFKPKSGIELGTGYAVGDSIDFANTKIADRTGAYVFANINLGQHLSMNLEHSFRKLSRDGGNVFVANQSDLRFSYQFNIRQRLRLAIINTNVNRDTSLYDSEIDSHTRRLSNQLIYSYKVNPKTLLFLGYSDAGREDQNINLTTTNRTFFVKFSYAWKR